MIKKIWLIIIVVSYTMNSYGNSVVICGKILNYANKSIKLNILRTDVIWLDINAVKVKSKTTKEGLFQIRLEEIDHMLIENTLEFGSQSIYISIAPGDSIFINCDYLNIPETITFSGKCSAKNYFINDFMPDFIKKNNSAAYDNTWLNRSKYELMESCKKYKIDSTSMESLSHYLDCHFYNYWITSPFVDRDEVGALMDTMNINDDELQWYFLYYSVINGYISFKECTRIDLTTDIGFERAFTYSEKHLIGSIKENYQAYLIGYSFLFPTREFKKSEIVKGIIRNYLVKCQSEFVKINLTISLKRKGII